MYWGRRWPYSSLRVSVKWLKFLSPSNGFRWSIFFCLTLSHLKFNFVHIFVDMRGRRVVHTMFVLYQLVLKLYTNTLATVGPWKFVVSFKVTIEHHKQCSICSQRGNGIIHFRGLGGMEVGHSGDPPLEIFKKVNMFRNHLLCFFRSYCNVNSYHDSLGKILTKTLIQYYLILLPILVIKCTLWVWVSVYHQSQSISSQSSAVGAIFGVNCWSQRTLTQSPGS